MMHTPSLLPYRPIQFGRTDRRLFGFFHAGGDVADTNPKPAVLLCNPFGQEAIRAHRFLRSLAERLARTGHAVLRFDYFGSGDSMGDDRDFTLSGCMDDVITAHDELRQRSGVTNVVWVGMRLGGTLALQAACSTPQGLTTLIVWDPILDGAAYLDLLRDRHIEGLEHEYSLPLKPSPRILANNPAYLRDEAIGFALSPRLQGEFQALRLDSRTWPIQPSAIRVLMEPDTQEGKLIEQVLAGAKGGIERFHVQHGVDWTSDTASNTSLVPTAALMTIAQQVGVSA